MIEQHVKVTLRDEALETLQQIADQRGTTLRQVLRQAIGHEKFLWERFVPGIGLSLKAMIDGTGASW